MLNMGPRKEEKIENDWDSSKGHEEGSTDTTKE